ncbi:hypothetical protein [Ulvibacterium marinum]|uniref:Uncharacterized protein n=1 Tax=Ulvibacterium marinum TaxID=2419782 RepID=A0A3B0C247_9FLAO|nr:hypothetical protein [Ulvibacterium marinum]RKN79362.1 hypothetical protein D7Z94_13675 [Ulvibacterium marinum]
MSSRFVIDNMQTALNDRSFHTITMWNRLEGRPRKEDFDRALKAEIRDALWMLSKQWQIGEFMGDDAGSPVGAKIQIATTRLNKYRAANHPARPFNNDVPLEAIVEQRPVPYEFEDEIFSLDIRLMMGRHWIKMLKKTLGDQTTFFIQNNYTITAPADPDEKKDAFILAHPEAWQKFAAVAGRQVDGYKIYKDIDGGINIGSGSPDEAGINALAPAFKKWVEEFFLEPEKPDENAWLPSRLEYQFACSAPKKGREKVYEAEEYYSGRLDWFNFSINDKIEELEVTEPVATDLEGATVSSLIPTNIDFGGMPNTRWWTFEERKTYVGDIKPNTIDIGKLLFTEFALIYANDWFLIPHTVQAGTISNVEGLVVANVFGERIWVEPTGTGKDDEWEDRWTMFTIDKKGKDLKEADSSLLMLPTVPKIQEGPAMERFIMVRDEIANMVWGIEIDITLPSGKRDKAAEAARELLTFYRRLIPAPSQPQSEDEIADIRYQIMNSVPENWIPFIPVHKDNDKREIQLQRASMPRIIEGDPDDPQRIRPRTVLLREGLDKDSKTAYYIHEEEVPRAGISVSQSFQRTRWYGGKVFNWLGARKKTGRGEGSSGLAFDQILPVKKTRK